MKKGSAPGAYRFEATCALIRLRPDGSLTILSMASSIGFQDSVSFLLTIQATGFLTVALVGLPPTEYASLRWTHLHAGLSRRIQAGGLLHGRIIDSRCACGLPRCVTEEPGQAVSPNWQSVRWSPSKEGFAQSAFWGFDVF